MPRPDPRRKPSICGLSPQYRPGRRETQDDHADPPAREGDPQAALPPLHCQLRWTDSYNAGVAFELTLSRAELTQWVRSRSAAATEHPIAECDISELDVAA